MADMTAEEFEREWDELVLKVSKHFKVSAEYEFILFVTGIQEMGWGLREFSKTEKMDLINVARCRILVRQGYIKETGIDAEGFPIFEASPKLKSMMPSFQNQLIKKGLIDYFKTVEFA
ncbi:hypothetical protein [Carboxylicivirga sp. RSCT41]|uniref:hypothetical protein n=1 Tax=Carboxylicivirga agarovorans TaxID=3417570 RepID=UPI003D332FCB